MDRKAKVSGILFLGKDGRYFFQATREQHGFFKFPNFVHGNFSYRHKKYPFAGYLDMEAEGTGLKFTLSYKKPLPGSHLHLESKDSGVALTVHSSEFLNTELKEYLPKGD